MRQVNTNIQSDTNKTVPLKFVAELWRELCQVLFDLKNFQQKLINYFPPDLKHVTTLTCEMQSAKSWQDTQKMQ